MPNPRKLRKRVPEDLAVLTSLVASLTQRVTALERALAPEAPVPQLIVHHIHHVATPEGPVDWDAAWRREQEEG